MIKGSLLNILSTYNIDPKWHKEDLNDFQKRVNFKDHLKSDKNRNYLNSCKLLNILQKLQQPVGIFLVSSDNNQISLK